MVGINADMGESFSLYKLGDDAALMPLISEANIACGFHGSDPNHMANTVKLAKQHNVRVGAHFSLPDLAGFGRREMKIEREELNNIIIYQIGALKGFLQAHDVALAHIKPHGALYGMAAKYADCAHAIADAAEIFSVPVFGLSNTLHEEIYLQRQLDFVAEFFVDLEYDDNGGLIITREHAAFSPERAAERCLKAVNHGMVTSINGKEVQVKADTVCLHSDTPNAIEIATAVRNCLQQTMNEI